jgi:putative flippase GtrA
MKQILKYSLIASIGYFVDLWVFYEFLKYGVHITIANIAGFVIGFTINFLIMRYTIFQNIGLNFFTDYVYTLCGNSSIIIMSTGSIYFLSEFTNWSPIIIKLIVSIFSLLATYYYKLSLKNF